MKRIDPARALDHLRDDRRLEQSLAQRRPARGARSDGRTQRRRERAALSASASGSPESLARTSSSSVSGTRKRLSRVDVHIENAGQLQREERVTARPLVDAEQRLARERPVEPVAQEPVERADAERPDGQHAGRRPRRPPARARVGGCSLGAAHRSEQTRRARAEPSQGERAARPPTRRRATGDRRSRRAAVRRSASSCNALRVAIPSARGSTAIVGRALRRGARPRARAASAPEVRAGRRRARPRTDRRGPTCASPRSASAGRDERTRIPASRACSTPASQSVDFPIPASPSSTSAESPSGTSSTKERTMPRSSSLPMICTVTLRRS